MPEFSPGVRARLLVIGGALLLLMAAVAVAVWHVEGPIRADAWFGVHAQYPAEWRAAGRLTWPGSPSVVALAVFAMAAVCALRRDWFALALCAAGPGAAAVAVELVVKPVVDRRIGHALAYPSGHVTLASAGAALAVLLVYRWLGARAAAVVAILAAAVPFTVGIGVIHRGWHYPTDAVGGVGLGAGTVLVVAAALSAVWPRVRMSAAARG